MIVHPDQGVKQKIEYAISQIKTAIEYTRATIGYGNVMESGEKPGWVLAHKGRVCQSCAYLDNAERLLKELASLTFPEE